ncbi:hypothetical protein D3C86_1371800 [compost metagenome]
MVILPSFAHRLPLLTSALSITNPPLPLACSTPVLVTALLPVSITSALTPLARIRPELTSIICPAPNWPAPEMVLSALVSTVSALPPKITFCALSDSSTWPPPVKVAPRNRISRLVSLPVEPSSMVPLLWMLPPNGMIAPSAMVRVPVLVVTGSTSNSKLAPLNAAASTPLTVIVWSALMLSTALPFASLTILTSAKSLTPVKPIKSILSAAASKL